ncbi:spore coat protein U domain-containing protein [Bartonella sp. HY761]|uniref:spore coat protein U domain-containing protein n=1 Tax=Bartonella sp. HY761 TaxID=2979330 RepID=UPI0021F98B14|nr:spore coat protein U domain-containing protein [Bartonella sp. HY761]UXN06882.1 spore coat protein U domain-containing protein [Bartonella sp. HY761]
MKFIIKYLATASIIALSIVVSHAETATNSFDVQITIKDGCTVQFPQNSGKIDFGEYAAITTTISKSQAVVVNCKNATTTSIPAGTYSLALNNGTGTGATTQARKLTSGNNTIDYTVYQASNLSSTTCAGTLWGSSDGQMFSGSLTSTATSPITGNHTHYFTVCIPVPASQPANGVYTDTLTATLSY